MSDVSTRLIREWEAGRMEEEGYCRCRCCGGEARVHREATLLRILRILQNNRPTPIISFLIVVLLLLVSGTLAFLVTVVLGGRGHQTPDSQPMAQLQSPSAGVGCEQQPKKDLRNPRAMLTAPYDNNNSNGYLEWEVANGNAFSQGGFNYSNGSLVVPRAGTYRVFVQITYKSKENLKCEEDEDAHMLQIEVFSKEDSYNGDVQLLSAVDSVNCKMKHWSKSLFTAGLFSLEANCRLRVTSTKRELIAKMEHQVFFGAELLP